MHAVVKGVVEKERVKEMREEILLTLEEYVANKAASAAPVIIASTTNNSIMKARFGKLLGLLLSLQSIKHQLLQEIENYAKTNGKEQLDSLLREMLLGAALYYAAAGGVWFPAAGIDSLANLPPSSIQHASTKHQRRKHLPQQSEQQQQQQQQQGRYLSLLSSSMMPTHTQQQHRRRHRHHKQYFSFHACDGLFVLILQKADRSAEQPKVCPQQHKNSPLLGRMQVQDKMSQICTLPRMQGGMRQRVYVCGVDAEEITLGSLPSMFNNALDEAFSMGDLGVPAVVQEMLRTRSGSVQAQGLPIWQLWTYLCPGAWLADKPSAVVILVGDVECVGDAASSFIVLEGGRCRLAGQVSSVISTTEVPVSSSVPIFEGISSESPVFQVTERILDEVSFPKASIVGAGDFLNGSDTSHNHTTFGFQDHMYNQVVAGVSSFIAIMLLVVGICVGIASGLIIYMVREYAINRRHRRDYTEVPIGEQRTLTPEVVELQSVTSETRNSTLNTTSDRNDLGMESIDLCALSPISRQEQKHYGSVSLVLSNDGVVKSFLRSDVPFCETALQCSCLLLLVDFLILFSGTLSTH
ncbi:unnamed protein product [Notodromas monacha]|uniref:Uncharacterized protein n=1 Tax=Notodromas monacha TaxID=399045 RepID=A0A7R9BRM6_9CRUS|nr:unnamed protein product [Notodromas monacha]CAG0920434.1 unnamed protein product [Notodromas monacha]